METTDTDSDTTVELTDDASTTEDIETNADTEQEPVVPQKTEREKDLEAKIASMAVENRKLKRATKKVKEDGEPTVEDKELDAEEEALDRQLWLQENASSIKLCSDEYKGYRARGYTEQDSLRLAKLDKGISSDPSVKPSSEDISMPTGGEMRSNETVTLTAQEKADADQWGYSYETALVDKKEQLGIK